MATPAPSIAYAGPQCPLCGVALPEEDIRTGEVTCRSCRGTFEATAFTPPEKRVRVLEVAASGPEGSNACATHARNVAVTSCERCGLFICALCEMNLGNGSLCPSCFERTRSEGALQGAAGRIRDYAAMAKLTMLFGLLTVAILGIPLGALAVFYTRKAIRQRRETGDSTGGMVAVMVFSIIEIVCGVGFIALMIIGANQ